MELYERILNLILNISLDLLTLTVFRNKYNLQMNTSINCISSKAVPKLFILFVMVSFSLGFQIKNSNHKLIVFEGSDWCPNCISFEKNVLSNAVFKNFLDDNKIEIEMIDFPQRKKLSKEQKKYNASVAEKYSFDGKYPTILLTNETTDEYLKLDYSNQTVDELIDEIKQKLKQLK